MANKDAAFGGRPVRHLTGGTIRANEYKIVKEYAANVFTGDSTGYTYNNLSSDTTGHYLKYRHRKTARFDLEITYKKSFSIGFSYQYNSKMDNIDAIFMDPLFESIIPGIPSSMERLNHSFHLITFSFQNDLW